MRDVPAGTYYVWIQARIANAVGGPSNVVAVTVTGAAPAGTTTWVGLAANGDGIDVPNDPECGPLKLDLVLTLVQSGNSVSGIMTATIRVAPECDDAVGFIDAQPIQGTVTGLLSGGSGAFTVVSGTGEDQITLNGTFAGTRMTGTVAVGDGASGTFAVNRQ